MNHNENRHLNQGTHYHNYDVKMCFYLTKIAEKLENFERLLQPDQNSSIWDSRKCNNFRSVDTEDQTQNVEFDNLKKTAAILMNFEEVEYIILEKQSEAQKVRKQILTLIEKIQIQEQKSSQPSLAKQSSKNITQLLSKIFTLSLGVHNINLDHIETVNRNLDSYKLRQDQNQGNQNHQVCLDNFITQVSQLRKQIQILVEQNESLKQQNNTLRSQKVINNPQIINRKERIYKTLRDKSKSQQKIALKKMQNLQKQLWRKDVMIQTMNSDFKKQIDQYNKVFQKLERQNIRLNEHIDWDLVQHIQQLQQDIKYLKHKYHDNMPSSYENFNSRSKYDYTPQFEKQTIYRQFPSQKIRTYQFLPENMTFDSSRANRKYPDNSNKQSRLSSYLRDKSKHSNTSRHSVRSFSPLTDNRKSSFIRKSMMSPKY